MNKELKDRWKNYFRALIDQADAEWDGNTNFYDRVSQKLIDSIEDCITPTKILNIVQGKWYSFVEPSCFKYHRAAKCIGVKGNKATFKSRHGLDLIKSIMIVDISNVACEIENPKFYAKIGRLISRIFKKTK